MVCKGQAESGETTEAGELDNPFNIAGKVQQVSDQSQKGNPYRD